MFLIPSASHSSNAEGTLAAVIYTTGSALTLSGTIAGGWTNAQNGSTTTSSAGTLINSISTAGKAATFKLDVHTGDNNSGYAPVESLIFHFDPDEKQSYIRNILNTNPQKVYSQNVGAGLTKNYWLGETYEEAVDRLVTKVQPTAGNQYAVLLPLQSGSNSAHNMMYHRAQATKSKSGWVINRNPDPQNNNTSFQADRMKKLFRLVSMSEGDWFEKNYYIAIEDLRLGTVKNPSSTFTVTIRNLANNVIEQFSNLTLDEASQDFIGKRIGDMYQEWDTNKERYEMYGEYENQSNYVYVEMADDWKAVIDDTYKLPWGFFGPVQPKPFSLAYGSSGPQVSGDGVNDGTAAVSVLTFGDGATNPGLPSNGTLTMTFGDLGTYTITFDSSAGSSDTSFTNNACTIDPTAETDESGTASRLLLNLRDGTSNPSLNNHYDFALDASNARLVTLTSTAEVFGPSQNITVVESLTNLAETTNTAGTDTDDFLDAYVRGNAQMPFHGGDADKFALLPLDYTASLSFPRLKLSEQNTARNEKNWSSNDFFGLNHKRAATNTRNVLDDKSYIDLLRYQGGGIDLHSKGVATQYSFVFSMDDVNELTGKYYWASGSHAAGPTTNASITAGSGSQVLLDKGIKKFALPMFGGFNGLDVTQVDPFSNTNVLNVVSRDDTNHYANYSIKKAIDSISDSEVVQYDVVSIPGLTNRDLTNQLIGAIEDRGDALALIDLADGYKEKYENQGTAGTGGTVTEVLAEARTRDLNTSYAATHFPRIRMRDTLDANGDVLIAPATVGAIGALAFSDANSEGPWFAPAGFNRGGLSQLGGPDGPRVIGTWKSLAKADRDDLYELNINPIARFPAVGEVVIFGQKTLQQTPSALDRINVRRLMVYLKKRIGRIADTILFDQNVQATWSRFKSQADLILSDVQSRFGIAEYRLILDETTTTPDLIDQNILYAKIFVKPARAIEFIAIDFVITRSGVQF